MDTSEVLQCICNLRNKTWSLSTSNMVNINSTIHAGYKVRHMKRSASAIQISYQVRRLCLFFTPEFRRTCKNYDRDISTDSDKHCNKFKNNGKQNNLIRNHNDFRLIIIKRNVVMFSVFWLSYFTAVMNVIKSSKTPSQNCACCNADDDCLKMSWFKPCYLYRVYQKKGNRALECYSAPNI